MALFDREYTTPETVANSSRKQNWLSDLMDLKDLYEEIGSHHR